MISSRLKLYLYLNVLNLFIYFFPFSKKRLWDFFGRDTFQHPAAQQFPWGPEANISRLPRYWQNFKGPPGLAQCRDSIRAPISGSGMEEIRMHPCNNSVSHNPPRLPAWRAEEEPAGRSLKQHVNQKSSVDTLCTWQQLYEESEDDSLVAGVAFWKGLTEALPRFSPTTAQDFKNLKAGKR